jgi:CheY-like chemotaxis protein
MDDDEIIREVVCMNLNSLGFTVESAKDGKEAIELYNKALKSGAPYDLLIMDLTVPGGMGGKETIKILKKINSEVKVIVSSGYSNDPIMSNYIDYGFSGTLIKPYDIDDLNNTVNQLLNEK